MALLNRLRSCDPGAARWLDSAFAAVTAFYGTDVSDPDHRHLASLSAYLEKVGSHRHFELMRYLELESSVYDPALQYMHVEFHHEVLCALDEAIQPQYGTIIERVEELARLAFLSTPILESLASHGEAAKEAYVGWLEEQESYVEAIRKLTGCPDSIGNDHAKGAAIGVCYELTGHEDLALQSIANGLVRSEPTQQGAIVTHVHGSDEMGNRLVSTPAGDFLGYMRPWPTGFWLATDDPSNGSPSWFRAERDARLWLARVYLGELSIIAESGPFRVPALSKRPHRTPNGRQRMSLHDFNWAEPNTGEVLLRFWDSHHGLQPGEYIEVARDVGASMGDLYWCGNVTTISGHQVYLGETELRHLPSESS